MDIRVRYADIDDAPVILSIFLDSQAETGFKGGVDLVSVMDWVEGSTDQRPFWVIENETNEVIGWCALESFYGLPAFDGTVEISIYIKTECQRQGLASEMMRYLEQEVTRLGLHTLVAYVLSANTASQGFFFANHFKQWGCMPSIARSGDLRGDLLVLGRSL